MARPGLDKWRAESIRFSYFYAADVAADLKQGLFHKITGALPETVTQRPAEGVTLEQGKLLGGQLTVSIGVNRVDLILSAPASMQEFPSLGPVAPLTEEFRLALAESRVQLEAGAVRLAHGVVATCLSDSRDQSYAVLDGMLSAVSVNSDSRDFFYQINVPRRSTADGAVMLNRVMRWAAVVMQRLNIVDGVTQQAPELHAVRVEIDVNTNAQESMEGHDAAAISDELIKSAQTILTEGDR